MEIHPLLPLFGQYTAPRFLFSAAERALLRKAVDGYTDAELAGELGLAVSAVKQRWVRIFDRVQRSGEARPLERFLAMRSLRVARKRDIVCYGTSALIQKR